MDRLSLHDPVEGALALLGCVLASQDGLRARIVEVEAYGGSDDPGSHAYRGITDRTRTMFGPPGHAYIYLSYGCHWMLNISSGPEGIGSAVLVRAAIPEAGLEAMRERRPKAGSDRDLLRGPGRLAAAFGITRAMDGTDLVGGGGPIWLESGAGGAHVATRRIGLAPGKGDATEWRFVLVDQERWASPHPR